MTADGRLTDDGAAGWGAQVQQRCLRSLAVVMLLVEGRLPQFAPKVMSLLAKALSPAQPQPLRAVALDAYLILVQARRPPAPHPAPRPAPHPAPCPAPHPAPCPAPPSSAQAGFDSPNGFSGFGPLPSRPVL